MRKVFFQGEKSSFCELAAIKFYDETIDRQSVPKFEDVFEMVKREKNTYGIIPIENTLTGSIHQNYDLLLENNVWIVGEIKLKITYNLLVNPDVSLDSIREVWSHPIALDHCKGFLSQHPEYKVVSVYDKAGAAKIIKEKNRNDVAAIAGPQAAGLYGLKSIKEKVEDHPQNFTRFLIISGKKEIYTADDAKTSLVFGVENAPGILFKCLSIFALRNIDLTKLESRPFVGKPWEYLFYIDFNGCIENENCKHAVDTLSEVVVYLKFLGSYESKW